MVSKKFKKSRRLTTTELILLFSVVILSIFYVIWRQSLVRSMTTEIKKLHDTRQDLANRKVELELDIISLSSEERIVDYAIKNFGMRFPNEDETAFIIVTEADGNEAIKISDGSDGEEDEGDNKLQPDEGKDES